MSLSRYCTTHYACAPEVFDCLEGRKKYYDEKVDVWAAGTVLFELLTGRILFDVSTKQV